MIQITKPYLPELEDYISYLKEIWSAEWLTNNGSKVIQFEEEIKNIFNNPNFAYLNNGTIALQLAIKGLEVTGEIITTPFSFIATTSSILWENCIPKFIDIKSDTLNINEALIEEQITKNTTAILATHCFGNSCNIENLEEIAKKHNLKLIFDGAHCFGTTYKGQSVFNYGDCTTISFHATKLIHSVEGGGVFLRDNTLFDKMKQLRNFGFNGAESFAEVGINGKNSELHAAMGLLILSNKTEVLAKRVEQYDFYLNNLKDLSSLQFQTAEEHCQPNKSYFPLLFSDNEAREKVYLSLLNKGISTRKYFSPSLNTLDFTNKESCPISESVTERILCLPMYHTLKRSEMELIINIIRENV